MSWIKILASAAALIFFNSATARAVTMQMSPVGYAGNAPDSHFGYQFGAVSYNYSIGTYDVTYSQYAAFLNAKASVSDPYGLWNSHMDVSSGRGYEGIVRSGTGPYSYAVAPGYANKPVVAVTWYDAIRFVNWLQNGQGNGDTESGTYSLTPIAGSGADWNVVVPSVSQRVAWASQPRRIGCCLVTMSGTRRRSTMARRAVTTLTHSKVTRGRLRSRRRAVLILAILTARLRTPMASAASLRMWEVIRGRLVPLALTTWVAMFGNGRKL